MTKPPTAPQEGDNDSETLARLVEYNEDFLDWLLNQTELFQYPEDQRALREEFANSMSLPTDTVAEQIRHHSGMDATRLEQVGLRGSALNLKFTLITRDDRRGLIKRILDRLNSLLGSLANVFVGAEALKEFKDQVEASLGDLGDRKY